MLYNKFAQLYISDLLVVKRLKFCLSISQRCGSLDWESTHNDVPCVSRSNGSTQQIFCVFVTVSEGLGVSMPGEQRAWPPGAQLPARRDAGVWLHAWRAGRWPRGFLLGATQARRPARLKKWEPGDWQITIYQSAILYICLCVITSAHECAGILIPDILYTTK